MNGTTNFSNTLLNALTGGDGWVEYATDTAADVTLTRTGEPGKAHAIYGILSNYSDSGLSVAVVDVQFGGTTTFGYPVTDGQELFFLPVRAGKNEDVSITLPANGTTTGYLGIFGVTIELI